MCGVAPQAGEQSGYLITRLHHTLRRALDGQLGELGLNTTQYVALQELSSGNGLSAADLAKRAYVRPQAMAPVVASLEERGLVERSRHRHNRRILEIRLTAAGRHALADCTRRCRLVEQQLLAGLSSATRTRFRLTLVACLANMDPPWHQPRIVEPSEDPSAARSSDMGLLLLRFLTAADDADPRTILGSEIDPEAVRGLGQHVDRDLSRPLAARIDAGNPELRADMVTALLLGIRLLRVISQRGALERAQGSDIAELFGRAFDALTTDARLTQATESPSHEPEGMSDGSQTAVVLRRRR